MMAMDGTSDNKSLIARVFPATVLIYNLWDPSKIYVSGSKDLTQTNEFQNINRFKLVDDYMFATSTDQTLIILNVKNRKSPFFVSSVGQSRTTINDITICQNYSYLAGGIDGVIVVDISNKSSPTFQGSISLNSSSISGLACFGDFLFLINDDPIGGLYVMNISNPKVPHLLNSLNLNTSCHNIILSQDAFLATKIGVLILNITDPLNLQFFTRILSKEIFFSFDDQGMKFI